MSKTLAEPQAYLVDLEDGEGRVYTGRITGKLLYGSGNEYEHQVFLTEDERILAWSPRHLLVTEVDDTEQLRDMFDNEGYVTVMTALGEKPVVDL